MQKQDNRENFNKKKYVVNGAKFLFDLGLLARQPVEKLHHASGMDRNIDRNENKCHKDLSNHSPCPLLLMTLETRQKGE
jgi:hypothetical protein